VHRFKVHLREFSCENLVCDNDNCEAYLHIDFDGQKFYKTDSEPDNANPEWGFKTAFHYAMSYLDQLNRRELRVQCFNKSSGRLIGRAAVNLHTIASGPEHCQLTLRLDGQDEPRGTLRLTCVMKMLSSDLTVICSDLSLVMQGCNAPATLQISSSLVSSAKPMVQEHSAEGSWAGPFSFVYESTLKEFARYDEQPEFLHFVFSDESGTAQGEASMEFRKWLPNLRDKEQPVSFKLPVTYKGTKDEAEAFGNVGELKGNVLYQNLPVFAQMIGGLWVDNQVEGGHLLLDGLPHPKCAQPPTVWQERPVFELLNSEEEETDETDPQVFDEHVSELLMQIDLPPPWEKRRERAGGRMHFFDPRSRRMTWKDPRFLPENWDQRIDPNSGRVYYQFYKTRGTTYVDPRYCPPGWDMRLSKDGLIYFAHLIAMRTTLTDPRGVPENADPALDDQGRMYFKNHEEKSTTWTDPREGQQEVVLAHWRHEQSVKWIREQVRMEMKERHEMENEELEDD